MKKKIDNRRFVWRYAFGIAVLLAGALLITFMSEKEFLGFPSVGSWLVYVGFVMLMIITLQKLTKKKRIVDERAEFIGAKASRITYIAIILSAFSIMILDGIKSITLSYSLFMSYLICGIILVYLVSYKILEKRF